MSGTKRLYNLDEKNYFKFFGVEEKQGTSIRSLSTHYKKILNILKDDNSFIGRDHKEFAHRAFNTLVDPILRARYILETNGHEWDFRDGTTAEDLSFISDLSYAKNGLRRAKAVPVRVASAFACALGITRSSLGTIS